MKLVLLTSNSYRHKYLAQVLSAETDLALIITEEKSSKIADTSNLSPEEKVFNEFHFESRQKSEELIFRNYKTFPKNTPIFHLPHAGINSMKTNELIDKINPNYIILFGTSIIKKPLLQQYSRRIINLHLGLSPYYKGSATNLFPYFYNEPECVGATIHLASSAVDQGDILHQLRPGILPEDDLHSIGNKTILKAGKILPEVLNAYSEKKILPQKQTGKGRICRNKDLTPIVLREIYKKFEDGIVEEYLQEKKERDRKKPIIISF